MKNKYITITKIIIAISLSTFIIVNFLSYYTMSYLFYVLFFGLLTSNVYISGLIINEKNNYQKNINIYLFLYLFLLFGLTLFINRTNNLFIIDWNYFVMYFTRGLNFIPFHTIIGYLLNGSKNIILINIVGNFCALMPLSFLLLLKDDKYQKIKPMFKRLFITVFFIEFMQVILCSGQADIDDFILNISGGLFLYFIIMKYNLIALIKKVFNTDFKIKKSIKIIIYSIINIIILGILSIMTYEFINGYKTTEEYHDSFIIETIKGCDTNEEFILNNQKIIFVCVYGNYYNKDRRVMNLQLAFIQNEINPDYFKDKLERIADFNDGGTSIYRSIENNITVIYCRNINGNNDIYIGDKNLEMKTDYCK